MEDRKSWAIKEDTILDDLVTLMGVTDEEKNAMKEIQGEAENIAPALVDAFYERLLTHAPTSEFLDGMVEHLRTTFTGWFIQLFSGNYDHDYVQRRLAIGKTHVRIGLPVRYPLAMLDILIEYGEKVAAKSSQPKVATAAFRKLAAMDIAIFNQAYENTQLEHLSEMVGNERLARRLLSQEQVE